MEERESIFFVLQKESLGFLRRLSTETWKNLEKSRLATILTEDNIT